MQFRYAEEFLNVEEDHSGFLLTAMMLASAVGSLVTGVFGIRLKHKLLLLQFLVGLGGVSSLQFPLYRSYWHLVFYMILQGIAFSHATLLPVIPSDMVHIQDASDAFGLQTFAQAVGFLGVPATGGNLSFFSRRRILTVFMLHAGWMYDLLCAYTPGFLLSGAIAVSARPFFSLLMFV